MKITGIKTALTCLCLLSLLVQGCATVPQSTTNAADRQDAIYTVKSGDSLSRIAQKLTGDASNWQSIAEHNNISDPDKLAAGDSLRIPQALLDGAYDISQSAPRNDPIVAASAQTTSTTAIGTNLAVQRASESTLSDVEGDVELHTVSVNRTFTLVPFDQNTAHSRRSDSGKSTSDEREMAQVKVVGTYVPKGVYTAPGTFARLMMRVAPGTVFELESEINNWFKVITDQGIGYLRSVDAVLLPDASS